MELSDWFKGFENGIVELPEAQRETFFRECGKNCVQCGTLQIYKDLYEQAAGPSIIYISWNAPAGFINKVMFRHLCSVNAPGRAFFMSCSCCGRIENSM